MRAAFAVAVALLLAAGCGPRVRPLDAKDIERPELLVDTAAIAGDFTARQQVTASFGDKQTLFQAIVQKSGERLVIVALTPQGQRAFVLEQRRREVKVELSPGVELPFSPWHILVDIHRSVFRGGGPSPSARADGDHVVEHPVEPMIETWKDGELRRRTIHAHGADAAVIIDYAPSSSGAARTLFERTVTYTNKRVGYTLDVSPL